MILIWVNKRKQNGKTFLKNNFLHSIIIDKFLKQLSVIEQECLMVILIYII